MSVELKPYPAYRDFGLPWLGAVPEHWEVRRAKNLLRCIDERSTTGEEELLTVSSARGIVPRSTANVTMFQAESYQGYKLCWPGDLVINSLWAWGRGLGVSRHHGIVSSAYGVYRFRDSMGGSSAYLHYLVRSAPFQWELQVRSKGIWISRLQLTDDAFLDAPILMPSRAEQVAIVRYLNHMERRVRLLIHTKKKMIGLLEEERGATIESALNRGLNSQAARVASGVPWLGDIPFGWKAIRLKHVTTRLEQGWSPQCDAQPAADGEWGVLKVGCTNSGIFEGHKNKKLPLGLDPLLALEIRDGDILVSRANTRDLVGLAALACAPREKLILCDKLYRFRAVPGKADPRFLVLAIRSRTSRLQIETSTNGASDSMQNIGQAVVRNLHLALPRVAEQRELACLVERRTDSLAKAIARAREEIDLLGQYLNRVVADVVIGRLDVRQAAASLSDDADGPELVAYEGLCPDEVEPNGAREVDELLGEAQI